MSKTSNTRGSNDYSNEDFSRRFEEITQQLGDIPLPAHGPRDWVAPEDDGAFIPPKPPPLRFKKRRTSWGISLLVVGIVGLILLGVLRPIYSTVLAIFCLLMLTGGLGIMFSLLAPHPPEDHYDRPEWV